MTLIITNDFPPRVGGIESFVAQAAAALGDVVVLTSSTPGRGTAERALDAAQPFEVVRAGAVLLPTPAVARRAARLLASRRLERVLFGAAAPLGLLAPSLRAAGARRIVAASHGHEVWWSRVPAARAALRRIGAGVDVLTTISGHTAAAIGSVLAPADRPKLAMLPPPVDVARFAPAPAGRPRSAGQPFRVLAAGRLVRRKNVATLLRAWPALGSTARLTILGSGPERSALGRLASGLPNAATVAFAPAAAFADMPAHYAAADAFCLPVDRLRGGLDEEGFGMVFAEAAAAGLPVVVGRSGGAPETVVDGQTGFVVEPRDPAAVAAALVSLAGDRERAAAMGAAGRAHAARFSTTRFAATLRRALDLA